MKVKKQKKEFRAFCLSMLKIVQEMPFKNRFIFCYMNKKKRDLIIEYIGSELLKNNRILSFGDIKALYKNPTKQRKVSARSK